MAINNTNTISTLAGVNINSCYIRLDLRIKENGCPFIEFRFYKDKASYLAGDLPINSMLPNNISMVYEGDTPLEDWSKTAIHDLAITELVARGMDNAKLAKTDLV